MICVLCVTCPLCNGMIIKRKKTSFFFLYYVVILLGQCDVKDTIIMKKFMKEEVT